MNYEINVSELMGKKYIHLFATHERSLTSLEDAQRVLKMLVKAFPAPQYSISISRRETVGIFLKHNPTTGEIE